MLRLVTAASRWPYRAPAGPVGAAYTHGVQLRPGQVEFKILGDTQVLVDGRTLAVGGPRTRALLAMLTVSAGKIVAADVLQNDLWPSQPAERAAANLQVRMSELRGALRTAGQDQRLVTRSPGYLLRAEKNEVDAQWFEALLARGREALASGDAHAAADHLRAALALWRGPALAGLADVPFARSEAARLDEARLQALELRIESELAIGSGAELAAELEVLTERYPLRERLWAQRMLALYRGGRQADALRCYQDLRGVLTGDLGIEPGSEVRQLEVLILRQDPSLDARPLASTRQAGPAARGPAEEVPETRYAVNGDLHIAYQVIGTGQEDILFVPGLLSHLDLWWEEPVTARFFRRALLARPADPLRQARHRPVGSWPRRHTPRGPDDRPAGGHGRVRLGAACALRVFRRRADEHAVRRDPPAASRRADSGLCGGAVERGGRLPLRTYLCSHVRGVQPAGRARVGNGRVDRMV